MNTVTRLEARAQGLKRFFTGKPCKKHGHVAERLTSSGECISCKQHREVVKYATDPSQHQKYYIKNRERLLIRQKERDDDRRADKIEYGRKWRAQNVTYAARYRQVRADLFRYHAAMRRAQLRRATPPWVERDRIRALYARADQISRDTGVPHEVDHIVPLRNDVVCGLHCLDNLQIITEELNRSKNNSFCG